MDTLVNVLTGINDSTEVAHDLVREQYKVIESVRTAFDSVNSDIQTLVATSEENAAMISIFQRASASRKKPFRMLTMASSMS